MESIDPYCDNKGSRNENNLTYPKDLISWTKDLKFHGSSDDFSSSTHFSHLHDLCLV